ncbi:hypothetical protein FVE67_07525 [Thermosulfurimonas marina]|uniref:Carbohydrate kinase PfkB domain-containing protein n=1 Tax=Thermosulfurimonas marina TaxID=2047767 RepID=A0A6H1WU00_9BACT|nr:PfkB family carbohydrate kinase [Thermosulfurimonas marina]QJA06651.1 hypothetical protein FVE67_07525 [Thermosulfurimonas marina]
MGRYLLAGHLTRDLIPGEGYRFGGAVLYAGLTVRRLSWETHVLTSCAERAEDLERLFGELFFHLEPSPETTIFVNEETASGRRQRVLARAQALNFKALPERPFAVEVLHLAPVLDEVPPEPGIWLEAVRFRHLVANPQGWFREVDEEGRVRARVPDLSRAPHFEALVVSEEDLAADFQGLLSELRARTEILVLTRGAEGASLFRGKGERFFPARKVSAVDPTGAGDVLAGAFFGLLFRGKGPEEALKAAMELAALAVTRPGLSGVPTFQEIANLPFRPQEC